MKCIKFFCLLLFPVVLLAQKAVITGVILDATNVPLSNTNVRTATKGTISDENGFYFLEVDADQQINISFSHVGYKNVILKKVLLSTNETFEFNPVLNTAITQIDEITITASGRKTVDAITTIEPEIIRLLPGATAGVENVLKLLPGVSSNNELSTQYNVRGGNFDENLVYVNEIEVYRPFLIRSGQQESLSFINSAMIQNVSFSAGGFQAKYGDKLSSVLDITYKNPVSYGVQVDASLLGANATIETSGRNKKLSTITGVRYRDNSLLINSQETVTNINPVAFDFQTYESYTISKKINIGFLGTFSVNDYQNKPSARTTNFGTLNDPKSLTIFYAGQEHNQYNTASGALKITYHLTENTTLKFIPSLYHTVEEESSSIIAQYQLGDLNSDLGTVSNTKSLGTQLNSARNTLDALIFNLEHKGIYHKNTSKLEWGTKYSNEDIRDQLRESEFLDSLGFLVRPSTSEFTNNEPDTPFNTPITALESVNATNYVQTNRLSAYLQYSKQVDWQSNALYLNIGARTQHWSVSGKNIARNAQTVFSPRAQIAFKPNWEKDMFFKIAAGVYHQPPFYREFRDLNGRVNPNVKAQKSIHTVLTNEYSFMLWNSPFKLVSEAYYKDLSNVNTYTVEDVRIRYAANNNAKAYVYGTEFRLNGAFVPGTESWVSLGYMKTEENSDNRGYIARPTDQRIKVGVLFQDYIPSIPHVKMYLNLVYNTGLPGGSPNNADPYLFNSRLRDYKRADLGISYTFVDENKQASKNSWLSGFKELSGGFELFNLFNNQNSITNTWVRDIDTKQQFAVPNYLTSRILNLKVRMRF
ncbi:TonB-dependent receptor [Cellulophaga baltica]|uniref:TonB-dependent receptor n=1 Tax=Cellulophaga baltica TaxID=76594 RepID=UPI000470D534|nr:carboxypeptidase-like regulatory domain-containing protein [Cellulophaga baltica]AIY13567.1 TonB-dependent receptor [Cellulophaga baltica NN016038]